MDYLCLRTVLFLAGALRVVLRVVFFVVFFCIGSPPFLVIHTFFLHLIIILICQ